ncbi:MAG: ATP synthase F1 subunit epsilon [Saprospiraceae bacterium]|nr:ATP synthase F1 subunit epsilon [Saprospiraceae bacterium]
MNLTILTPDQSIFSGEINAVKVPGFSGEFQILNNHAPLVAALRSGKVAIKKVDGQMMNFTIQKGFIEVLNNQISLLVQGYKAENRED